jgi:hypothetical protein
MPTASLKFLIFILLLITSSCILKDESPVATESPGSAPGDTSLNLIQSGDIIVANVGNDTILQLDSDGSYKGILYDSPTDATLIFNGLTFDDVNEQILFTYDSTTAALDSVRSISLLDGSSSVVITNSNLNGTLQGLARLTTGELLVLEATTAAEKFLANGTRSGAPFTNTLIATTVDINKLSTGGFVACSTATANTVRTYSAAAAVVATATSATPVNAANVTLGAVASSSCIEDSTGQIIVAYSGATDAIRVYNSALSAPVWTFIDTNVLTSPGRLALRSNGNILITDTGFNHIVELTSDGALVGVIGGAVLSVPTSIVVVP